VVRDVVWKPFRPERSIIDHLRSENMRWVQTSDRSCRAVMSTALAGWAPATVGQGGPHRLSEIRQDGAAQGQGSLTKNSNRSATRCHGPNFRPDRHCSKRSMSAPSISVSPAKRRRSLPKRRRAAGLPRYDHRRRRGKRFSSPAIARSNRSPISGAGVALKQEARTSTSPGSGTAEAGLKYTDIQPVFWHRRTRFAAFTGSAMPGVIWTRY